MKSNPISLALCLTAAAVMLAGCDSSKSKPDSGAASEPALPKTQEALASAAGEAGKVVSAAASNVTETAKTAASDLASQLASLAKTQSDTVLSSIGQDLSAKAKSLADACTGNPSVKTNLDQSLSAMLNGKDSEALAPAFKTAQTRGLTAGQLQLAKEVGNLASAFVVQRNFSSLQGAQGDVSTLVSSLRNGQYTTALPPLQKIMSNASLTQPQKDLLGSLADKYAPSLKQAAGSLQQGLQSLQGLKK